MNAKMTYVKICGITNLEDAQVAAKAGADLLGFIFYPPSPRYVAPEQAAEISYAIRRSPHAPRTVGVFVNEAPACIRAIVEQCALDLVQLSGDESPTTLSETGAPSYKALRPRTVAEIPVLLENYRRVVKGNTPAFLVDAFNPKLYGGTGERADWTIARRVAERYPILLAGGLTPDNIVEAVANVQPWGVDVASGVERAPGLKDHGKVKAFIESVRRGDTGTRRHGEKDTIRNSKFIIRNS